MEKKILNKKYFFYVLYFVHHFHFINILDFYRLTVLPLEQTKNNYQKPETWYNHIISKPSFAANSALPNEGLYIRFGLTLVE